MLTTREKLPGNGTKMDKYTLKLSQTLAEVELCELEQADAVELLKACSNNQVARFLYARLKKQVSWGGGTSNICQDHISYTHGGSLMYSDHIVNIY
jgi:hypothetical protein